MMADIGVPTGIVENMSGFRAPDTGRLYHPFGAGGGARLAERYLTGLAMPGRALDLLDLSCARVARAGGTEVGRDTWIDIAADALNRLVRPVLTLAIFAPVAMTIHDPEGMARVWMALATMPPGYWAVAGIVLPFYFGGRMQVKSLEAGQFRAAAQAAAGLAAAPEDANPALEDWHRSLGKTTA